jgi:HAD superfamily hydrolase (TIGR01509 family)
MSFSPSFSSSLFAAVLFDCDGVLVDSEVLATRALYQSLMDVGLSMTLEEVAATFTGQSFLTCVATIERHLGHVVPDDFAVNNRRYYRDLMQNQLVPMPGVKTVLEALTLPYAVVTNSQTRELDFKLTYTGLDTFFPTHLRFDTESLGVAKPDPEIYLRAADALNVDIKRCLIVEDSFPGITAGTRSGATVWAYRPHPSPAELNTLGVTRVFSEWADF